MREPEAQAILDEVSQDRRIQAQMLTRYVKPSGNGYRIKLMLRKSRILTIRLPEEWHDIKCIWSGL